MAVKRIFMMFIILMLSILIVGCSDSETSSDNEETEDQTEVETDPSTTTDTNNESTDNETGSSGGELTIAVTAQPPVIDPHMTTANVAIEIARNVFEPLVTTNEQFQPTLMLADSVDTSEDGLTYTFHLREGITFHNGKEMTSEDVVASMNRWLELSSRAQTYLSGASFEAEDPYTAVLTVQSHSTDVLEILSSSGQFPGIMPKEVIESADVEGVTEIIGTGPFKFEEWAQDQYIHLSKFDEYQSVEKEPSGLSGKKEALVDDAYFRFVSDTSTRLAGVQTGEYDIADLMPHDQYEHLSNMENVETHLAFDEGTHTLFFNKKAGLMADEKMRQAVNAALDNDAILLSSYAGEDLYKLDSNYMNPDQVDWATDAGSESYNQNDPEKAKRLLEEAGYNGETLVLVTSRDYDHHYNAAVVVQEQLEQIGMDIELEVYDWPTYTERREDPELWDMITIGLGYSSTPAQQLSLDSNWIGWTEHPRITELLNMTRTADTQEGAKEAWDELQGFLWNEYVPIISFGHRSRIIATTDKVEGFRVFTGPILWNVSVSEQ